MRRILLTAAGVAALTLSAPVPALAAHHHHHKRHAHHARVSFKHLGPMTAGTAGPGTTPSAGSTPSTSTPTPATTPAPEENAGKVASYSGGVLTLTLGNGSTVSGKVTVNTRFECVSTTATQPSGDQDDEGAPGDDNGMGDDQSRGDRNQQGGPPWQDGQQPGSQGQGDDEGNGPSDDQDNDDAPISTEPPCDSSALTEGAIVRAAELRIAPGGTEFESIELVR
ncbi:MAG: hypothetical protein ACRDLF_00455 [Solirubrobacteraceae bacterium]